MGKARNVKDYLDPEKIPEAVTIRFKDLTAEQAATLQEILEDANKTHGISWDIVNKEWRKKNQ